MRHGRSQANDAHVIACSLQSGLQAAGLPTIGHQQARHAAEQLKQRGLNPTVIVSSDFLRALQTAQHVAETFNTSIVVEPRLRERDFGSLDGKSTEHYQ